MSSTPGDPRLGDLIKSRSDEALAAADVVIFGAPTDEGILRNGGRPGASQAPDEIRKYLGRLTPFTGKSPSVESLRIADLGNVSGATLEETHSNAKELTAKLIAAGKTIIALGGGHDISYPLAAGFSRSASPDWRLVNIDAHLDVRQKKNDLHHSGSSFRLLIEEGHVTGNRFAEFAIQPFAISREHYDWILEQGASVLLYDDIAKTAIESFARLTKSGVQYLSFDIDSIRSSDAPGCSAPSSVGLSGYEACQIARLAGANGTQMLDIAEVSPPYDIDGRTSRLAARMIVYFLAGVSARR